MSYGDLVIGDDGWLEIVGEQTRGGGGPATNSLVPAVGGDLAMEILGELSAKSPAFKAYAEKRAALSRPMVHRQPLQKARDWQIDFGPVCQGAGTTTTVSQNPQCLFRAEKVMATDTGSPAGTGTRIQQIFVGNKLQRPANAGATLTLFFANNALGNGVRWDTCEKALSIAITVSFITGCTFDMTVFGKAVMRG
jgi:hypothetical protein